MLRFILNLVTAVRVFFFCRTDLALELGSAIAIGEALQNWFTADSRRLVIGESELHGPPNGTPGHADDGVCTVVLEPVSIYYTARITAVKDAQSKIDAKYGKGNGWHTEHCTPGTW
jgi:hypothetical protein